MEERNNMMDRTAPEPVEEVQEGISASGQAGGFSSPVQAGGFPPSGAEDFSSMGQAADVRLFSGQSEASFCPVQAEGFSPSKGGFSPPSGQTVSSSRKGVRAYRAAWVFLVLQVVTVLLTASLIIYFFLNFLTVVNSAVTFYVAGLILAFLSSAGFLLGGILFVVFGVCCLVFSSRAITAGVGGGRAKTIRLITAILTGLGFLYLLAVLGLTFFSLLLETA